MNSTCLPKDERHMTQSHVVPITITPAKATLSSWQLTAQHVNKLRLGQQSHPAESPLTTQKQAYNTECCMDSGSGGDYYFKTSMCSENLNISIYCSFIPNCQNLDTTIAVVHSLSRVWLFVTQWPGAH